MVASPSQIPTDLALEIGAELSPERFMTTARAFFGYIEELSQAHARDGVQPRWVVRVREGSTLLGVEPIPGTASEIVQTILSHAESGIGLLVEGNIAESGLPDSAIKHLRTLAEIAEGQGRQEAPVPMRLWIKRKPIAVEPAIASIIREDLRADHHDYGAIEGRLETIQESNGTLQFQIRDAMLRQRVRCYFPEHLLADVFEKFRKRVEVSGVIHYRKSGAPISIVVEQIVALPDDSDLPTARDVRGILSH